MAHLQNIICVVMLLYNVPHSIGLIEGATGASWSIGVDIPTDPGNLIGNLGGDVRNDIEEFSKQSEHIGGDIAKAVGEVAGDVKKGVDHIVGDIGEGIEKGAESIVDGAKGAIDGIEGIVGKLTPKKKEDHKKKDQDSSEEKREKPGHKHHGESEEHSRENKKDEKKHQDSQETRHHNKHSKDGGKENHERHENHHDKKNERRGNKHHYRPTGRGIDGRTGIGSHDGIRTPILNLLGLTQSVCKVSYAAESLIEDLGELHIWADKQMGIIEHAAVNYIIDNVVLNVVDGARRYHNKIVNFMIDTHIGIQRLVTNSIIEVYRITKAPVRELFACH